VISLILSCIARTVLPVAVVFAIHLLLRGHQAPGGGFIAGLLVGAVLILQYVAIGTSALRRAFRINYRIIMITGLALAVSTGCAGLIWGTTFLYSHVWHWQVPFLGTVELASAAVFDMGVFLVIVGSILLILGTIGEST